MAENPLPEAVEKASEATRHLLRRASQEFHDENPYVPMVTRGAVYLPPEAKIKHAEAHEDDNDTKDGDSSDDDTHNMMNAPNSLSDNKSVDSGMVPASDYSDSVIWHARIVADDFRHPKHTLPSGELKPRRPLPQIKASALVKGLTKNDGYYYFTGQLNEWPALQGLMLVSITKATAGWGGLSTQITRMWNAKDGKEGKGLPAATELGKHCRATFWAPSWSRIGWSPSSPGFVFWYSDQHEAPRLLFGSEMISELRKDATAHASITNVHVYVHRYPVEKETVRDKQTWHALGLVEWEHGLYTTVLELAFLNAIGGYGGKSNWVEDKLAPTTKLFQTINAACPGMVQPWNETRSEIRMTDVPMKNLTEFEAYLHKYSNNNKELPFAERRFIDPARQYSGKLKLRSCNAEQLGSFMLNYIQRVWGYRLLQYNCQTFATDLFAFLTGQRNIQPYANIVKAAYKQHIFSFLYEPAAGADFTER